MEYLTRKTQPLLEKRDNLTSTVVRITCQNDKRISCSDDNDFPVKIIHNLVYSNVAQICWIKNSETRQIFHTSLKSSQLYIELYLLLELKFNSSVIKLCILSEPCDLAEPKLRQRNERVCKGGGEMPTDEPSGAATGMQGTFMQTDCCEFHGACIHASQCTALHSILFIRR
ncbi:unnamed protein product, partial [Heterotrigona itama]